MKISFDNQSLNKLQSATKTYSTDSAGTMRGIGSSYEIKGSLSDNNTYEGNRRSFSDFRDSLKAFDVESTQDYMTFMAHSMSEEDFSKMMKSGERPSSVDPDEMVTILDRIKLYVAKSGQDVKGFTDTLDDKTIEKMTGSPYISQAAKEENVTLDEQLCEEIGEAVCELNEIDGVSDGMKKYLVSSNSVLSVHNLYIARHCAPEVSIEQGSEYFSVEAKGYLVKKGNETGSEELAKEVENLLEKLGIRADEENISQGKWLVENSLCVNKENVEKASAIDSLVFPLDGKKVAKAIAIGISEGKRASDSDLTRTESVYEMAVRLTDELSGAIEKPFIRATRILEETRLKMTTEANLLLIRSDVAIDTKDIEAYVEALKEIEGSDEYKLAQETEKTLETIETVKKLPAAVLAPIAHQIDSVNLADVVVKGDAVKARLDRANVAYEQVGTEVRKDLGDSIKKAFRNVPDILLGMGMEDTPENRRAVRILGYNSMPVSKESVEEIREADRKLQSVINRLTPSDTISLIREGRSPIKMSVDELNRYLDNKSDVEDEEIEKYSKFLYKLERDKDITPEERADYIEVYRFFHQIEKTEASAIGAVINAGAQMTFENLKTAMKTTKHRGMDVTVGEVYETLAGSDDDLEAQWISHKFEEMKEALNAPEETVTELVMSKVPVTADNLEAALLLRKKRGEAFKKATQASDKKALARALSFSGALSSKEAKTEYMGMADECKTAVYEESMSSDTYMDVRALQLVHRQLTVAKAYADVENYEVPMEIGGEVTSVNVKIVHNSSEDPNVVISLETEELGRVTARLSGKESISGYIACNSKEAVTKMKKAADILGNGVSVVFSANPDTDLTLSRIPMKDNTDDISAGELYRTANRFLAVLKG